MARRKQSRAEGFVDIISILPWWLCLALAVISYLTLKFYIDQGPPTIESSEGLSQIIKENRNHTIACGLKYFIPILFSLAAFVAALNTNKKSKKSITRPETIEVEEVPLCPKCGSEMVLRTAKKGSNVDKKFWGCSKYPKCKGTINVH